MILLSVILNFAMVAQQPTSIETFGTSDPVDAVVERAGQEHGPDVECDNRCIPSDWQGEPPKEIGGVPTYTCSGGCTHGEKDPCAEGKEAGDCPLVVPEALLRMPQEALPMRPGCDGKTAYDSLSHARKAARRAYRRHLRDGNPILPYPCSFCRKWHIGHQRRRAR